jgi:hypothetical protein
VVQRAPMRAFRVFSESCIKGHRSSTCKHTERPLFEVKKKGRPSTQCEHCRELRRTKQVHVKCNCEGSIAPVIVGSEEDDLSACLPAKLKSRKGELIHTISRRGRC